METKKCNACGEDKPLAEFTKKKKNKDGIDNKCQICLSEYNRAYYKKSPKGSTPRPPKKPLTPEQREKDRIYKKAYNKKYNEEHKERIAKREADFKRDNPNHAHFLSVDKKLKKKGFSWKLGS